MPPAPARRHAQHLPVPIRLLSRPRRLAAAALVALAGLAVPYLVLRVLTSFDPPLTPPLLFRLVLALIVLPAAAAHLLRGRRATADVEDGMLVLASGGLRFEVPCSAIVAVRPWAIPLPEPGLDLTLRSGRRLASSLAGEDLDGLLLLLDEGGARTGDAARHPVVVWAHARFLAPRRWWDRPLVKLVLFGSLPAALLFRVHQIIAFGGFWGAWYQLGPGGWTTMLAVYWTTVVIYCALYAGCWRGLAEAAALAAAAVAPSRAVTVRRLADAACRIGYYGGVPLLLGFRFLA